MNIRSRPCARARPVLTLPSRSLQRLRRAGGRQRKNEKLQPHYFTASPRRQDELSTNGNNTAGGIERLSCANLPWKVLIILHSSPRDLAPWNSEERVWD